MKLNLLPKTAGTENNSRNAAIFATLFIIVCGVAAYMLNASADKRLADAKAEVEAAKPAADKVVKASKDADAAMAVDKVKHVVVNSALAKAMVDHCFAYTKLYKDVIPYVPSYFRLTELSASPVDATNANLNMTGVISTYQEYADLMLALMRIPGAQTVGRAGFQHEDMIVPAVSSVDQSGKPRKPSEGPIPDDALDRLAYFEQKQTPSGYLSAGGFGAGDETPKLAPAGKSLISVTVLMARNIQTPNPRATLAGIGSASTPAAGVGLVGAASGPGGGAPPLGAGVGGSTPPVTAGGSKKDKGETD